MAKIRIKRSTGAAAPTSLELGELAVTVEGVSNGLYNNKAGRLFVGNSDEDAVEIGGEYYARLLDHQPGYAATDSAIIVGAGYTVDQISITQQLTAKNILISGIATFQSTFEAFDITAQNNVAAGTSITVGVASGADAADSNAFFLSNGTGNVRSLRVAGLNTGDIFYPVVFVNPDGTLNSDDAFRYESSNKFLYVNEVSVASSIMAVTGIVSTLSVGTGTDGNRYTFPTSREASAGQILIADGNGQLNFADSDERLRFEGDSGTGSVGLNSEALFISGTPLEITTVGIGTSITIGLPDDVLIGGGLTVTGNMTVNGNLTYLSSTITQIEDKNIELGVSTQSSDATADGGGITIKGDTDKNITYALSRAAFTVNQNWEPISGGSGTSNYNLGSSSAPWGRIFIQDNANIADLDVTGIATFRGTVDVDGTLVDIAQDLIVGRNFRAANGITTLARLFSDTNPAISGVGYAGTDGEVGFSSAPSAGISTSHYVLTAVGIGTQDFPVWTDTIDCGTY